MTPPESRAFAYKDEAHEVVVEELAEGRARVSLTVPAAGANFLARALRREAFEWKARLAFWGMLIEEAQGFDAHMKKRVRVFALGLLLGLVVASMWWVTQGVELVIELRGAAEERAARRLADALVAAQANRTASP